MNLNKKLIAVAKIMGARFTLKGRPLSYEELFAESGLLPGLSKRADQLASLCFGYGIGAKYEDVEGSLLGTRVIFDEFTPDVLRLFCLTDVLNELIKGAADKNAVALDELMYD